MERLALNTANSGINALLEVKEQECDRYLKALERIKYEATEEMKDLEADTNAYGCFMEILDIINKVKDKICYWDKSIDMSKATLQVDGKVICKFDNDNQTVIVNDGFKTPRELELEKKLNIALKALNKISKFNRILSIENDIVTAEYTEAAQIAQDALMQIEKWRSNE